MKTEELILLLKEVMNVWHTGTRPGNDGNQGNTLEDLLGVEENNISLPDLGGVFELKTQKKESNALITLMHSEPTIPKTAVPKLCIALGWPHKKAGSKYPDDEMSFRSTTSGNRYSTRGFKIRADDKNLELLFSPNHVAEDSVDKSGAYATYGEWLESLNQREIHYSDVLPVKYDMKILEQKIREKLDKTVLVLCKTKRCPDTNAKLFFYDEAFILTGLKHNKLVELFNSGGLYLDFDARTRHNHGTKIRIQRKNLADLFENSIVLE
ncbi:MvaI/BcnI family restriction endonuclease [uncultured Psychrobacter sp.]|uniref:MvaI/BcnI family restriction endonuclease n=1 Tax=uncultured Psychrobacter sp. TaxID=259303 RepID=UPI00345AD3F1